MKKCLSDYVHLAESIVSASVQIYQMATKELLPTPSKSHYTYNLRDLSGVFQGMLMIAADSVESERCVVDLWLHETSRVFRDRLTDKNDRMWFDNLCAKLLQQYMPEFTGAIASDLYFGEYLARGEGDYKQVRNPSKLSHCFMEACEDYNLTFSARMDLVFFDDAIRHISRISRITVVSH